MVIQSHRYYLETFLDPNSGLTDLFQAVGFGYNDH